MTTTTRDDLVRWIEAGAAQGFDAMIATDDPSEAPVYYRQEEDGSPELDEHLVRLFAGGRYVQVFGIHGDLDEQIDWFLRTRSPMKTTEADVRRYLAEIDARGGAPQTP